MNRLKFNNVQILGNDRYSKIKYFPQRDVIHSSKVDLYYGLNVFQRRIESISFIQVQYTGMVTV